MKNLLNKLWEKNIPAPKKPLPKQHSFLCDIDPVTMTWKKDLKKGDTAMVCFECQSKALAGLK